MTRIQKAKSFTKDAIKQSSEFGKNAINKEYTTILNQIAARYNKKISKEFIYQGEDAVCGFVAKQCYEELEKRIKNKDGYILEENLSSKTYAIYIHNEKKIIIFGIRGTDVRDIKDLISDIQIVLDIQSIDPRVKEVLSIYDTLRREYQGYKIRVCGHSLGGTLSYIIGKHRNPDRCVVFNPGVSLNSFFIQMLQDTLGHLEWTEKTYTYKILGDIISSIAFVGHTNIFSIKATDPLQLHTVDNFIRPNTNASI